MARGRNTFEHLNAALRERLWTRSGRNARCLARVSPTPKLPRPPGWAERKGYDGNKKVRGRKRHLLVDTEGLVFKAKVHSAKMPDQDEP